MPVVRSNRSAAEDGVTILPMPTASRSDKKNYKSIQLPNGLRALLISDTSYDLKKLDEEEEEEALDETTDEEEEVEMEDGRDSDGLSSGLKKSAAGLSIGMGSFSDLPDLPGLAHFLEHMVFMGSAKYPDENAFDQFVQKHGGFDNAHTDCELTTFFFEIQRRHFREALDRFAHFFIRPLMKKEAMQREREAVDSEFQMSLPSDSCRRLQIMGTVMARPDHPMAKFMWGNLKSLQPGGGDDDDEVVHAKLHEFRRRHYAAQSMTLTVQSQETLETLERWVVDSFSGVPTGERRESFEDAGTPFDAESGSSGGSSNNFHKMYRIVPVKDVHQLDLCWSLPSLLHRYRVDPLGYLSHIIGHEGRGSLISHLRKNVWALSLVSGNSGDGFEMNSTCSLFTITIVLTKIGYDNLDQVMLAVFSYLKMVRSKKAYERIFTELKTIRQLDFEFGPEPQSLDNVENLCEGMQLYQPELYLTGGELLYDFDAELIDECARQLDVDKVNVCLTSKADAVGATKVEPWFKTRYADTDFTDEQVQRLKNAPSNPDVFFLPEPNVFIAQDVSLLPDNVEDNQVGRYPIKVLSSTHGELFYKQDTTFRKPRVMAAFNLLSSLNEKSVENAVCLDLFVNCLDQLMVEDVYPATEALLDYTLHVGERGEVCLKVGGLNDKLSLFLKTILKHWREFGDNITDDVFCAVKEQTKKNYFNFIIKPSQMVRDVRLELLQDVFWPTTEKHRVVQTIQLNRLKTFWHDLSKRDNVFVQGLVQGNISAEGARQMFDLVCNDTIMHRQNDDEPEPRHPTTIRCNELPVGSTFVRVNCFNPKDTNTLVTNYYQAGPGNLKMFVGLEVVAMLMEEPVFDILRTKEQLGYAVFSQLRNTYGILAISLTVNSQANKFSPEHVDARIEAFLAWFVGEKMKNLSKEEFDETVATLIKQKRSAYVTLAEEFDRNWSEIVQREYAFDRLERSVELLEACNMQEIIEQVSSIIANDGNNPNRRKLSSQVVGNPDGIKIQEEYSNETDAAAAGEIDPDGTFEQTCIRPNGDDNFVTDVSMFKSNLKTYPASLITK